MRQNITGELLPFIREVNFQMYGDTMFKTKSYEKLFPSQLNVNLFTWPEEQLFGRTGTTTVRKTICIL